MKYSNEYLTVIKILGEALEKRDFDISIQSYEISELKSTIEKLEKKVSESIVLIHKD